jgi:hypothetical protein
VKAGTICRFLWPVGWYTLPEKHQKFAFTVACFKLSGFALDGQVVEHEDAVVEVDFCQTQCVIKIFVGTHYSFGCLSVLKLADVREYHPVE